MTDMALKVAKKHPQKLQKVYIKLACFRTNMESILYSVLSKLTSGEQANIGILKNQKERKVWKKTNCALHYASGWGLLWNGLKVPTLQQVEQMLQQLQYVGEKNVRGVKVKKKP